jgi:nicotinate-nucleotide pyrophosphorylase (carboxylating)
VLAGPLAFSEAFTQVDDTVRLDWQADDGDEVTAGKAVARAEGLLSSILTAERTALNFLGHLSGIATQTSRFVAAAAGRTRIWDTRKTTPGLRALEKAAVRAGGGANHRGNLTDWVLLKDNHLAVLGIAEGVRRARERWPARTVQVECDTFEQMLEAIDAGADLVMLDNMSPEQVAACVREASGRVLLEVSGGVTAETIAAYAAAGPDFISSGALTNSAPVLDVGLDIVVAG